MYRESRAAGMLAAAAALAAGAALTLTPGAPAPRAVAEPSPATTTSARPDKPQFPSDERGYLDSAARCDDGQTLMMFGRTSRSLVAVCVGPDAQLEYRGVRLSDQAGLTMAATRAADGAIVATNDAVTYSISPQVLLVSEDDTVLYRDPWLEYHKAGFPAGPATASSSATPSSTAPTTATSTAATSTSAADTTTADTTTAAPTVNTTTVTLAPTG